MKGHFGMLVLLCWLLLNWIGINEVEHPNGPVRELHLSGPAHIKGELQEKAVLGASNSHQYIIFVCKRLYKNQTWHFFAMFFNFAP